MKKYLRFAYNQSYESLSKAILFSLLLGLIFTLSVGINIKRGMSDVSEHIIQLERETGCKIRSNELVCDDNYYKTEDYIIDLRENPEINETEDVIIFTKDKIYIGERIITYQDTMITFDVNEHVTLNVLKDFIIFAQTMFFIILIPLVFIFSTLFFIIANLILAFVMKVFVSNYRRNEISFVEMYKLTFYAVLPYVIINSISRILFGVTPVGYLTSLLPFFSLLFHIIIDYVIIGWIIIQILKVELGEDEF